MPRSVLPSFLLYCYITGITPGPANLCSLSAALRYGKTVALRQWCGIATGFLIDSIGAVILNRLLGGLLGDSVRYLSWISAAYIFWLAWHILRSARSEEEREGAQPGFLTGLFVNLTNVKVILFCITALSSFVLPYTDSFWWLLGAGLFLPLTGPVCNLIWLFAGTKLKNFLSRYQKQTDIVMAAALILCALNLIRV